MDGHSATLGFHLDVKRTLRVGVAPSTSITSRERAALDKVSYLAHSINEAVKKLEALPKVTKVFVARGGGGGCAW